MLLSNPRFKPLLVLVERQVPVFRFAQHGFGTTHSTFRVNQFGRRKSRTTLFALVAIGTLSVAMRTFARDIAVGQEGVCFLVVVLFAFFFQEFAFFVELTEKSEAVCLCTSEVVRPKASNEMPKPLNDSLITLL